MDRLGRMGQHALTGWRGRVAEPVADRVSRATPMSADAVRALIGAAFFAASLVYVVKTVATAVRDERR